MLYPFLPEQDDEVERLKGLQAELHTLFIDHVKARRSVRLNDIDDDLFSGGFWAGKQAHRRGLIDGLGDVRQVTRSRFGENVKFRTVKPERGLLSRFGLGSLLATSVAGELEARSLWSRYGL